MDRKIQVNPQLFPDMVTDGTAFGLFSQTDATTGRSVCRTNLQTDEKMDAPSLRIKRREKNVGGSFWWRFDVETRNPSVQRRSPS